MPLAEQAGDLLSTYVSRCGDYVEHLGQEDGVLVVSRASKSAIQRNFIVHSAVGSDRETCPRDGLEMENRREAGVPEEVAFQTKPQLAREMLERAVAAGIPFRWVTGDEVSLPHVLAIKSS